MENDFSVIDKLVAFGLEASFAAKMISSMNGMMSGMSIPCSMASYRENDNTKGKLWFVRIEDKSVGPIDEKEIMSYLLNGSIGKDSLVWTSGMTEWKKVEEVPEILKLVILLPPEI